MALEAHLESCRQIAKTYDYERYCACLFAPSDQQWKLFTLLAAVHEIAKTAEVVSDPMIGLIRLQWWQEALDGIEAGTPREHEVVQPLNALHLEGHSLEPLRGVISAREADLEPDSFPDTDAFKSYCRETSGTLFAMISGILRGDEAKAVHVGTAWAMLGSIRAGRYLLSRGRNPFPSDLLAEEGTSAQQLRQSMDEAVLTRIARHVASLVRGELAAADGSHIGGRAANLPVFLLKSDLKKLLHKLEKNGIPEIENVDSGGSFVLRLAFRAGLAKIGIGL